MKKIIRTILQVIAVIGTYLCWVASGSTIWDKVGEVFDNNFGE